VLGLTEGADYETVNRTYKRMVYECKMNNKREMIDKIEAAHSTLMTRFMMQRIQAGANTDVARAGEVPLLPWRPRVLVWAYKWMAAAVVAAALPVAWAFVSPSAGPQPIQFTFFLCLVLNCLKLWQWSPPPANPPKEQQKAVIGILSRGAGLTLGSVTLGIFVAWSLPDLVMGTLVKGALPAGFYEAQWLIMTAGAAVSGCVFNIFFR